MPSKIQWTDETWNPVTGCTKISPGCAYCYAERLSSRFKRTTLPWIPKYEAENMALHPERLEIPLRWQKPRRIFVNSMSDLFHERVPNAFLHEVFGVMVNSPQHTFQVLTKRPERMRDWLLSLRPPVTSGTLRNIWLGVSVENQYWADRRIPLLLQTPAAVRFVSAEPLLGPLMLLPYMADYASSNGGIDWLIVGGESGGPERRYMKMGWLESIAQQTRAAGVPLFVKQDSGKLPGRWGRIPEHLRIREFPDAIQGPREGSPSGTGTEATIS